MPKITAWSFSRYRDYKKCAFYAKCKYIDRMPEPEGPALERGSRIHKLAEGYLKAPRGSGDARCPSELILFQHEFRQLRRLKASAELEWAFNANWEPVDWFAKDCWLRIKVDAWAIKYAKMGLVVDFKTGKVNPAYDDQLSLYALGAFQQHPDLLAVDTQLWYIDHAKTPNHLFKVSQLQELKDRWADKTRALLNDETFAPTPNDGCRWCAFSKTKGGPCRF